MTTDDIFKAKLKLQLQEKTRASRKQREADADVEMTATGRLNNDAQPRLVVVDRDIDAIQPARRRTRKTTAAQLKRVMQSLQTYQQMTPIVIDVDDRIVAGHIVWEAMRQLGAISIQCVVATHLDEDLLRGYAILANRSGEQGEWLVDALRIELQELQVLEVNLEITGFTPQETDIILLEPLSASDAEGDDNEDSADSGPPCAKAGDIFDLDNHRVLCADAIDPKSYELLMGEERAHCVFSDAPYNCRIEGNVGGLGKHKHKDFAMGVGEMSDEAFIDFLQQYLDLCRLWTTSGAVVFACMDWRQISALHIAGKAAGLACINVAAWTKGGGMGSLYRSAYELVTVFCNGQAPATNNVQLGKNGRDRTNVWAYPGANRKGSSSANALADHPTPKPINLVADAIRDVTRSGDLVLDPFLGSGTTLVASERTGRTARCIELDPIYVDCSIRRWQKMTGRSAIHRETRMTFDQLAESRMGERGDESKNGDERDG